MAEQYCSDNTDVCKDAVSTPCISKARVLDKSLRKTRSLSYMHQEAFITYVKINKKSFRTFILIMPWNVVNAVKNLSQTLEKCECEKLDVYEGLRWFKASIWNISGEGYYMHKISSVWRRQKIDKEQHRI